MNSFFQESLFAGLALSLVAYVIGMALKKKLKIGIFHPLLISIIISIAVLAIGNVEYEVYQESAKYLSYLLTPATVCLAIPLYELVIKECRDRGFMVETGRFGADMQVYSDNDGPVTIIIDSKEL